MREDEKKIQTNPHKNTEVLMPKCRKISSCTARKANRKILPKFQIKEKRSNKF